MGVDYTAGVWCFLLLGREMAKNYSSLVTFCTVGLRTRSALPTSTMVAGAFLLIFFMQECVARDIKKGSARSLS